MKTSLKLCLGIVSGLVASWLIAKQNGINWTSAGICMAVALVFLCLYAVIRSRKSRTVVNKTIVCVLVSTFAVAPWTLVVADDTYAGYTGSSCYCIDVDDIRAASEGNVDNAVVMHFVVEVPNEPVPLVNNAVPRIMSVARANPSALVSWSEISATFLVAGIDINQQHSTQYAKNGTPVSASEVPFVFNRSWQEPFVWQPDQQQYRVVVETTSDLSGQTSSWQTVARFSIPANTAVQYQDTPDGEQAFYRIRLDNAPADQIQPAGAIVLGCGLGLLAGGAVVAVLTVRACARNKKKFQAMQSNSPPAELHFNLFPTR